MHTLRRFAFFLAVSLSGLRAETWNQTAGGTYSWNDSANWSPASFPSSASAVANLTANIAASQTINLNQAITVGSLLVGDSSGNTAYTIAANGGSLTFDNGASAATLTKNASTAIDDFTAPITIGSNGLIVDVQISGGFVRFATVSGGNLTKTGVGTLILNGSGAGLTGSVTVSQGVLQNSNNAGLDSNNAVTVSSGATFRSRAQTEVKSISGSGTVDMNLNGASVAVGSGGGKYCE